MSEMTWPAYRRLAVTPAGWRYDCPGVYVRRENGHEEEFHPHNFEDGSIVWERLARLSLDPDGRMLDAPGHTAQTLLAIVTLTRAHGRPPTVRELAEALGCSAHSTVHARLERLQRAGWVAWDEEAVRTLAPTTHVHLDPAGGDGHVERSGETVARFRPVAAACPACGYPNTAPLEMPAAGVNRCRHCAGEAPAEEWYRG